MSITSAAVAAEKLATEIVEKRIAYLEKSNSRWKPAHFYASSIPECDRQLVHSVLDWDKKPLADSGLLAIFDAGKAEEARIGRILSELGYELIAQQNPIEIRHPKTGKVICTGRIDGKIIYKDGEGKPIAIPCEMKSMADYLFQSINSLEDFQKRPLHRKYLKQMQLYLYGNNIEAGLFIISNFRQIKVIPVYLDYGFCEQILKQLDRAWEYVEKGEYPDPIDYRPEICDNCPFEMLCTKTTANKAAELIDSPELEANIERFMELKPAKEEYDKLDKLIKTPFKENGILNAVIGTKYQIVGRRQKRISYDTKLLTDEEREKIKTENEITVYKIGVL